MKTQIKKIFAIGLIVSIVSIANATTIINVTTNVIVRDVKPIGLNTSDNYYEAVNLKTRAALNFEGVLYRQIHTGVFYTNGFVSAIFKLDNWKDPWTSNVYLGAKFRLLSGNVHGITGTVINLSEKPIDRWNNGNITTNLFFEFDRAITAEPDGTRNIAIMIEDRRHLTEGFIGTTNDWWCDQCELVTNDAPPDSFGNSSCKINAGGVIRSIATTSASSRSSGETFRVTFKTKSLSGSPTLTMETTAGDQTVPLTASWTNHEYSLICPDDGFSVYFKNTGSGALLIDDILIEQLDSNPSGFRDDMINLYKDLKIGTLRFLNMGGWSMEDQIKPWNETHHYRSTVGSKIGPYYGSPHSAKTEAQFADIFSAAQEIGCIPWVCVPGVIYPEEMDSFVEFVCGPTNTTWGKIRAESWNHPKPYTETLDEILVEFGNEAWNTYIPFLAKGYNGRKYWEELIRTAKNNSYYTNNLKFITAGQNWNTSMSQAVIDDATNADMYAIAPYSIHGVNNEDFEVLDPTMKFETDETRDKLFEWFMAVPMYNSYDSGMPGQYQVSKDTGMEFSFYEFNYHCTSGSAPKKPRRDFTSSIASGISMANYSLSLLKNAHVRYQSFFTAFGRMRDNNLLWGTILNGGRYGDALKRWEAWYRPVALAHREANRIRNGNLMETVHTGDDPSFSVYGKFDSFETNEYKKIYSYAFQQDNGTNGIVLFNYDLNNTQDVQIILQEYVKNDEAECFQLSASHYTNANEWCVEDTNTGSFTFDEIVPAPVSPTNYLISNFSSGYSVSIAPCSEYVFKWVRDAAYPNLDVSVSALTVPEGGTNNFILKLTADPIKGPITATVERISGDTNLFVQSGSPAVLNSANWDTGILVTIAAAEDPDTESSSATFQCLAPGMAPKEIVATEVENDLGIVLSTNAVSVPEGSSANFQIKLSMDPGSSLTVTSEKTSGDADISVSAGASRTFDSGNWDNYQSVTLDAAEDGDIENGTAIISCFATGLDTQIVTATENDNDSVALLVTPVGLIVDEGGSETFNLKLTAIPPDYSTVQVFRVSGDTDLSVSAGEFLVFDSSNYNTDHPVTISAAEDDDKRNGEARFKCHPLFPNTDGPVYFNAVEKDNDVINASFQDGVNGYSGTIDTDISEWNKTLNRGAKDYGYIQTKRASLIKWDLTDIPNTAYVASVTISLNLRPEDDTCTISAYALNTPWVEGDNTSGSGADWNTSDGSTPWDAGVSNSADRGALVYQTTNLAARGSGLDTYYVFNLNEAGVAYVQDCINNPSTNSGFIFQNLENNENSFITYKENSTPAKRPKISIGYYFDAVAPTNASVIINNGDAETTNFVVELNLFAENPAPVDMQISELADFSDANWIEYQTNYSWTFAIPFGIKTIYSRFSDGGAAVSSTASDEIEIIPEPFLAFYFLTFIIYSRKLFWVK